MRLIDADLLLSEFERNDWHKYPSYFAERKAVEILNTATIIEATTEKRGKWIMDKDPDDGDCRCSNCSICIDAVHRRNHEIIKSLYKTLHNYYRYCPACGCRMEDSDSI